MDITLGFLIYATLFRLAILAVGAASILLGYLLFVKDPIGQGKTTALAEAGNFKLTLKNFWPGAYFATFGTVIIGLMLWQGNPELIMKELTNAVSDGGTTVTDEIQLRGNGVNEEIAQYWDQLSDPDLPLSQAADPISHIARIWQREQRTGEALGLVRLAVRIEPANPAYLAMFAELLRESGDHEKALEAMKAAAKLDKRYGGALSRFQERSEK